MKLNNKAFAISTIIYGLLLMAILIMMILLSTMSFNRKSNGDLVNKVEKELQECTNNGSC